MIDSALAYADSALAIDPRCISALTAKYDIYGQLKDQEKLALIADSIRAVSPWLLMR